MAIYAMNGMNINSGVHYTINGAVYVPTGSLIPNIGNWSKTDCTSLVAQSITFNSGATMNLSGSGCKNSRFIVPTVSTSSGGTQMNNATVSLAQ